MVCSNWKSAILCDGKEVILLDPPMKNTLLWHITNKCNQSCKYCYGSFTAHSYSETSSKKKDVPLERLLETVDDLSALGFERIHICGGEPFLRDDIWPFLLKLSENDIESFLLTNLTFLPHGFEQHFRSGLITSLSFSLDSTNTKYNDWVRGNTSVVINNVKKIVETKKRYKVPTELGLYGVITKMNIDYLDELIDWAIDTGLDYISLQLVYLPKTHKYNEQFVVTNEDRETLRPVFEHLKSVKSHCRIPGDAFLEISRQYLLGGELSARNCFCERGSNHLFIDGVGNVKCCSTKHDKSNHILGNICRKRLKKIKFPNKDKDTVCSEFSLDCLGVWEMAHPLTFEVHLSSVVS